MDIFVVKNEELSVWEGALPQGFFHGYGVFETFKSVHGKIFRLEEHLDRMEHGARHLELKMPKREEIRWALATAIDSDAPLYLKLILVLEEDNKAELLILRNNVPETPANLRNNGISATIISFPRNTSSPLVFVKSLSYMENLLARRTAQKKGHYEGLFLGTDGNLTEGAHSNLFWVKDGKVLTPIAGSLPGITREAILEICRDQDIPVGEGGYAPEELLNAEEAFISGSVVEILPLVNVDGHSIGTGKPGEYTKRLINRLSEKISSESLPPLEPMA